MKMRCILATAKRNLTIQMRAYPIEFFLGSIISCVYLVLGSFFIYRLMFNGQVSGSFVSYSKTQDYMSFIIIGAITYLFIERTLLNVGRSFITEMREGTLDSLLISPMKPADYLVGNMLLQTFTTMIELIIAIIICIPFGINFSNFNVLSTILCIVLSLFALFGVSILLGGIMVYLRDTFVSQNTLFYIILFTSGISFPIEYLPKWVSFFSQIIPVTYILKVFRSSVLLGTSIVSQKEDFIILGIQSIVYCALGLFLINKIIKITPERQFI